jgi:mannose-1-phosphate guanylyltransferase
MSFRAMVLAAGVGSRLSPLTDIVPKPLVKVAGRPIMEHILLLLKRHGVKEVISNTHHLAEQIHEYFKDSKSRLEIDIQFVYEDKLSGVAGGIRCCQDFLKESTACIIMGDAITDIDLSDLYEKHLEAVRDHACLATVAQMQVEDTSQFGVIVTESLMPSVFKDSQTKDRIVQFQEKPSAKEALSNWANTGVYFFEPEIYNFIPTKEEASKYDVAKDLFPRLLKEGKYIQAISVDPNTYWADLGTPKQYLETLRDIESQKVKLDILPLISPEAQISKNAKLRGINEIGSGTIIEDGVEIENSVIWDKVKIGKGAKVKNSIISTGTEIAAGELIENRILVAEQTAIK